MTWTYTNKAETDGVGNAGDPVDENADLAWLRLHGYCECGSGDGGQPPTRDVGALDASPDDGAIKNKKKTRRKRTK